MFIVEESEALTSLEIGNNSKNINDAFEKDENYAVYLHMPTMVADIVFGILLLLLIVIYLVRQIKKVQAQVFGDENSQSFSDCNPAVESVVVNSTGTICCMQLQ